MGGLGLGAETERIASSVKRLNRQKREHETFIAKKKSHHKKRVYYNTAILQNEARFDLVRTCTLGAKYCARDIKCDNQVPCVELRAPLWDVLTGKEDFVFFGFKRPSHFVVVEMRPALLPK